MIYNKYTLNSSFPSGVFIMVEEEHEEIKEKLRTIEENPFGVHFDPIETLKQCLYHSDDEIRARAAKLVGSFPNADFIEPLFRLVAESDNLDVRKTGIDALGSFLHQARMSDYHLESESEWELDEDQQMDSLNPNQFGAIREFMGELVEQEDWPSSLRAEALPHYARLAPDVAMATIDRFYNSPNPDLQAGAVKAIAWVEGGNWERIIHKELLREARDERFFFAVEAAGAHRITDAVPKLADLLNETRNRDLRRAVAESLSLIPWGQYSDQLEEFVEDDDPEVQQYIHEGVIRQQNEVWERE